MLKENWIEGSHSGVLEEDWNRLGKAMVPSVFYFSYPYFTTWCSFFAPTDRIPILTLTDGKQLRLIAPFLRRNGVWRVCADEDTDHPLILFDPQDRRALELFWHVLTRDLPNVCIPNLSHSLAHSAPALSRSPTSQRTFFGKEEISALGRRLEAHRYKNLRNWFNRRGVLRYISTTRWEEILAYLPEFMAQHIARWAPTTTPSIFEKELYRRYCHALVRNLGPSQWLTMDALVLDNTLLAMGLGTEQGLTKSLYMSSFNATYAKQSPGKLLLAQMFSRARAEGLTRFDLLRGTEAYKKRYRPRIELCHSYQTERNIVRRVRETVGALIAPFGKSFETERS